ncbi:hypothetical protein NHQ30_001930 [Ciborinia camelliae]|nr:hypothetical protein NHQ30_001930 [Ciborinia camelliae]
MGWFGSSDLSVRFGLILGGLILIVFIAGLIKVLYNKRRLAKNIKIEEHEKENSTQERLNVEELGEGDLFGIRAIERGFYGGVSQSRPSSPVQSMFGPPSADATDLSETSSNDESARGSSAASSSIRSSSSLSRLPSEISVPNSIKQKPSHLRLQPSNAEIRRSARPNLGGSYIPPSPIQEAHSQSKSDEKLTRLPYQGEVPRNYMFLAGQHGSVRSQSGSMHNSSAETSPNNPSNISKIPTPPASTEVFGFPPQFSQRARSTTPEEPTDSSSSSPSPELPFSSIAPSHRNSYQPTSFKGPDTNNKRRSYQPTHPSKPQSEQEFHTRTSVLDNSSSSHPRPLSEHPIGSTPQPRGRSTYNPYPSNPFNPHDAQHTQGHISRTNDSIRISRKSSQGQEHRHSRDRDQIYYDPTSAPSSRNRSGSVQGRSVNFDHSRESPFSNSNAISGNGSVKSHSSNESFSSASTDSSRDSSREGRGRGRGRSESESGDYEMDWRGRNIAGETIVEVLTPRSSRGPRFDASDSV